MIRKEKCMICIENDDDEVLIFDQCDELDDFDDEVSMYQIFFEICFETFLVEQVQGEDHQINHKEVMI